MTETTKNTGIYYLGSIPKNWKVAKYGRFTVNRMGETILASDTVDQGIPVYSATQDDSIFGYVNETNLLLKKGDFVIPARGNSIGCVSVVKEEKATCSQTTICSRNIHDINNKFLYYCVLGLKSEWFRYEGSAIPQITVEQVKSNYLAYPSQEEQARIADFLDKKVSEIDAVISKTKESIEEYKKLKQSIITEAVTKGLDPNAETKDSGIEWIGLHSSKAEIVRLKFFSYMKGRVGWQGLKFEDFIEEGPYCITGTDFENGKVNWRKCYHVSQERYEMDPYIQVKNGDLLITKDGTIGKLAIINDMPGPACLNSHLLIIRPLREKFTNKYLYYVMKSDVFLKYYKLIGSGKTTMDSLSQENTGNFSFPAYDLQTQNRIVEFLDYQNSKYDEIIFKKEQVLTELEQYKKSLIYEYVTGKKEVN
jgi:type I restriction enzyme S subunit